MHDVGKLWERRQDFSTLPGYLLKVEVFCPVAQEGELGGLADVDYLG